MDTQASGFSLGETGATVLQPMMYQIAPSKSYSAWTIHCAKVQQRYAADERWKENTLAAVRKDWMKD